MQLQFSLRSEKDLERLFDFLIQSAQSIKTADKALHSIKDGAISLIDNPDAGKMEQVAESFISILANTITPYAISPILMKR